MRARVDAMRFAIARPQLIAYAVRRSMTQFLLVRSSAKPDISGFVAASVAGDDFLGAIADRVLGSVREGWVIRPRAGEIDDVVGESIVAMEAGVPYRETPLARALAAAVASCHGLALFWSSFPDDLPAAASLSELHGLIETQLREEGATGEVYGQWNRAPGFERGA